MVGLLERFVNAHEKIANSLELLAKNREVLTPEKTDTSITKTVLDEDSQTKGVGATASSNGPINYKALVAKGKEGREELLRLCKAKGIDTLGGRLRTHTAVDKLEAWDLSQNPDIQKVEEMPPAIDEKEMLPQDEEDPFAVIETPQCTIEQIRAALQEVMERRDRASVLTILQEIGGVTKLIDLPEDKYNAVMEACK